MTNNPTEQRCSHPACLCTVGKGEPYCSEHCRKRVESPLSDQPEGCECGHAECMEAAQRPNPSATSRR